MNTDFGFLSVLESEVKYSEPLAAHCSFKIGGPAAALVRPLTRGQFVEAVSLCRKNRVQFFVLGRGTNVLFSDSGYDGAVILSEAALCELSLADEDTVYAGAGTSLSNLCRFAMQSGLTGLEFAYGIPGSVGGAVFMNAGAYGGDMSQCVESVEVLDCDGCVISVKTNESSFGYRCSEFQKNGGIILGARFKLEAGHEPDISAHMQDILKRRAEKQPLEYPSAGSVFKRPVGAYAGELIERCGLKGASVGGAQVSEKHAGFIVNRGGATAQDVVNLVERIKNTVREQTGYELECEIRVVE